MDLDQPVATTEFVAVDTETNGLAGEACELTEVGAVLVGGGELHDRWETLVAVRAPLSRGIQRFTGITQAMVDEAPAAEATLPELAELLRGRGLVAHNSSSDRRVLRQAFERGRGAGPGPARPGRGRAPPRGCSARARSRGGCTRSRASAGSLRWRSRWASTSTSRT